MGLFDKIFKKKEVVPQEPVQAPEPPKVKKPRKPKEKKVEKELSDKEKATQAGEPYVNILSMQVDPNNIDAGVFELDWNDIFIARLVKAGYMMKKDDTDVEIIDRWWTQVCRNTALEVYEQAQADPENRDLRQVYTKDLGNGRTEVS